MNGIGQDFKTAVQVVLENRKKLFIPYLLVWLIYVAIVLFDTLLPDNHPFLLLLSFASAIASLAAISSIGYTLACCYQQKECKIFEGFKLYGWKFIVVGLLMLVFTVPIVFIMGMELITENTVIQFLSLLVTNIVFTIVIVAMLVDELNPIPAIGKGLSFLMSKFKKIIIPLTLAYSITFLIQSIAELRQLSSLITGTISLLSYAATIWFSSLATKLYIKYADHWQPGTIIDNPETPSLVE